MCISQTSSIHFVKMLQWDLDAGVATMGADDCELKVVHPNLRDAIGETIRSEPIVVKVEEIGQKDG